MSAHFIIDCRVCLFVVFVCLFVWVACLVVVQNQGFAVCGHRTTISNCTTATASTATTGDAIAVTATTTTITSSNGSTILVCLLYK